MVRLLEKISGLEGEIRRLEKAPVAPAMMVNGVPTVSLKMKKPTETWAAVVQSSTEGITSEQVVQKVIKEVGPTLGVRVHEVRALKSGGAIIGTPSIAEREKLVKNENFTKVGLSVAPTAQKGTMVTVSGVYKEITPEEFMDELHEQNLSAVCTKEEFKKAVRIKSQPWKPEEGSTTVNVTVEGPAKIMYPIAESGRVYIKWFSFRTRQLDVVASCYRCYGTDHRVKDCRRKAEVCKRCGQDGHRAMQCENALNCRDCAFRGKPAGHLMLSASCPIYATMVARADARH